MNLEILHQPAVSNAHLTPILFVHGALHAAWCWDENFLPYFAQHGYASYAVSLRGHGESGGRPHVRFARIAEYVEDVAQAARQLPRVPIVVGHSMGGFVLQEYLETNEAPAVVLLASVPPSGVIPAALRFALRHPLAFLRVNAMMNPYHVVDSPALALDTLFSRPDQVEKYFARLQDESYFGYFDMLGLTRIHPDKIHAPMLVLGALNDHFFTSAEVQATARTFKAPHMLFPNMAHDMMIEADWQVVADKIIGWLQQQNL